jgi:hypothetical protein
MAGNWIAGAIRHPGALHEDLGVPKGQTIGHQRLLAASKQPGVVGQRARLALTLEGMHGKKLKKPAPKRIKR